MHKSTLLAIAAGLILSLSLTACASGQGKNENTTVTQSEASTTTLPGTTDSESEADEANSGENHIKLQTMAPLTIPDIEVNTQTVTVEVGTLASLRLDIGNIPGVDYQTDERGAIAMDATVMFDFDSAELSAEGKTELKKFIDGYVKAVFRADGTTDVKKITVEGHTDTDGSYEYNKTLSEKRANAVMKYCIEQQPKLKNYMVAKGCSYDYPVKKSDGSVDKAASRRVCFVAE